MCYYAVCVICRPTHKNIFGAMNTNKGITIGGTTINNLRYADDTALLAEIEEDMQQILNEVNCIGKTFDIKISTHLRL